MPNIDAAMGAAIITQIEARLGPNHRCLRCANSLSGPNDWTLYESLVCAVPVTLEGSVQLGGETAPLAMLVCNRCFAVEFFAVLPMGVLPPAVPVMVTTGEG